MMISVIIGAYNAENTIGACLRALETQQDIAPDDYEVIVVDDGSTDKTASICEQASSVCLIQQDGPLGPATARNNGLKTAQGNIICFTDVFRDFKFERSHVAIFRFSSKISSSLNFNI